MRILICGDRYWNNIKTIISALQYISLSERVDYKDMVIIEGEASGADKLGKEAALMLGVPKENILEYPAPWGEIEGKPAYQIGTRGNGSRFWKAAGPVRNRKMLNEGNPDIVLAFHRDITVSYGTKDMVTIAMKAGKKVIIQGVRGNRPVVYNNGEQLTLFTEETFKNEIIR